MTTRMTRGWSLAIAGATLALGATVVAQSMQINGAGATFPNPIYSKWFSEYNKVKSNILINYQPIGSGGGIRQMQSQTVFFGATDTPMTDDQLAASPGRILHFPTVIGSVVPAYNLPGVTAELKFSGALLADIFLGKVTKWNDPAIAKLNAGVTLPAREITVVHRSEGSGTTYIFVDFLAKTSPEWKQKVGVGASPNWPTGVGAKGNEGVAGLVKQTEGSIGYVEPVYAVQNKIPFGAVQNMDGVFVKSSIASVTAAAAAASAKMPADFRVSITNPGGKEAYPISSFTWILFYESPSDKPRAKAMVEFMQWALGEGQKFASDLGYSPLPATVVKSELEALKKIKVQ